MPLDRAHGEVLEGLGADYQLVPVEAYASTPAFSEACSYAARKLKEAGAIERPLAFYADDVIAQYYPRHKPAPLLVFIFCKKCRGGQERSEMSVERFVWYQFSVVKPLHMAGHA